MKSYHVVDLGRLIIKINVVAMKIAVVIRKRYIKPVALLSPI